MNEKIERLRSWVVGMEADCPAAAEAARSIPEGSTPEVEEALERALQLCEVGFVAAMARPGYTRGISAPDPHMLAECLESGVIETSGMPVANPGAIAGLLASTLDAIA